MSVAAEIWKDPVLKSVRDRIARPPSNILHDARHGTRAATPGLASLVRQIFFSPRRNRLLLTACGAETNISSIAQRMGEVLSQEAGRTVGLIEGHSTIAPVLVRDHKFCDADLKSDSSQIGDRLWRMSADLLGPISSQEIEPSGFIHLPFDYVLFAAPVDEPAFPQFCRQSEGAVLVLTANQTRKEAALRAKRILQHCEIDLLGTLLDARQFPIPESIYQRL